jgi:hypothetical protein
MAGKSAVPKPTKHQRANVPIVGNVVMTSAIASAFVSVGLWIAEDFFHLNIPAHLAPPLATILVLIAGVARVLVLGIVGLVIFLWNTIF